MVYGPMEEIEVPLGYTVHLMHGAKYTVNYTSELARYVSGRDCPCGKKDNDNCKACSWKCTMPLVDKDGELLEDQTLTTLGVLQEVLLRRYILRSHIAPSRREGATWVDGGGDHVHTKAEHDVPSMEDKKVGPVARPVIYLLI